MEGREHTHNRTGTCRNGRRESGTRRNATLLASLAIIVVAAGFIAACGVAPVAQQYGDSAESQRTVVVTEEDASAVTVFEPVREPADERPAGDTAADPRSQERTINRAAVEAGFTLYWLGPDYLGSELGRVRALDDGSYVLEYFPIRSAVDPIAGTARGYYLHEYSVARSAGAKARYASFSLAARVTKEGADYDIYLDPESGLLQLIFERGETP